MTPMRKHAFLSRLAQDTCGNTLAIMAAAVFPLIGLIGGGVDISRMYLVKARLQQACDAGSLAARKAMGSGSWNTAAEARANELFTANFRAGAYGTSTASLVKDFEEEDGVVTGTASVDVPMTLMRVFGFTQSTVNVSCTAEMEIPNTDVMFVLDTTLSMMCAPSDGSLACNTGVATSSKRITGLRKAVKCFYEALLRANTPEVCGNDPTATAYNGTAQVRLGFVPYASNVNVGKLLPTSYFADNWTYQSRVVNTEQEWGWTAGPLSAISYDAWSPGSTPTTYNTAGGFSSFSRVSSDVTIGSTTYVRQKTGQNNSTCPALNTMADSSGTLVARTDIGETSPSDDFESSTIPDYPEAIQDFEYSKTDTRTVRAYRYRWFDPDGFGGDPLSCWLERSAVANYNRVAEGTATKDLTWTSYQKFVNYTYQPVSLNVSALKAGASTWNPSVALPLNVGSSFNINPSGSTSSISIRVPTDATVGWNGCVLERDTYKNLDGDPTGEFDPIPSAAKDLDIDLIPSAATAGSQWGPMLPDAVWGRYTGTNTNNWTTGDVTTITDFTDRNRAVWCPDESRLLRAYTTAADTSDFVDYIDDLTATGQGTYHDVGMLWGARLISPTGIFAAENALTPDGGAIERHLIFMTDGSTQTVVENLYGFGMPWWDRRQSTLSPPTTTLLDTLVNERTTALCTRIKNMNITLWVISYGAGVNTTNKARLQACASPGHFYDAADTATLISNFQQIASEIADLRLTN